MKKSVLSMLAVAALVFGMTSCNGAKKTSEEAEKTEEAAVIAGKAPKDLLTEELKQETIQLLKDMPDSDIPYRLSTGEVKVNVGDIKYMMPVGKAAELSTPTQKARALGIQVEDYITDKVINVDIFERAQDTYENIDPDLIDKIYSTPEGLDADLFEFKSKLEPNECFILKSIRASVLARYNPFTGKIKKVEKSSNYGIQPRNAEQSFAFEILNDPDVKLVGLTGKAGTGKTLLALAAALKQAGLYKQILLARPIVALANKDIGFLPGDEKQKVAPYMQPLFDNLNVIKNQFAPGSQDVRKIDDLQKNNQLVIEALAFIRGRSLSETFCIIDEAQNLTPHEIKTIITRAGEGTKMVFTGDIQQIDSPYLDAQSNGLAYMVDKMKGQELFAHINLIKGERSQLSELASDLL